MARVKYKTRSPDGGTYWYEQDVPDDATPQQIIDHVEGEGRQVLELERMRGVGQMAMEAGKSVGRGLISGIASLAEGAAGSEARKGRAAPEGDLVAAARKILPRPGFESTAERYINSAGEGMGGALSLPVGSLPSMLVSGGLAGLGGQLGSDATNGSKVGELAGNAVGGLGSAAAMSVRSNAPQLASQALKGTDEVQLAMAQQRMHEARKAGMPINLSQGMQVPSNIDDLVTALANSSFGDKTIQTLRTQPEQLRLLAQVKRDQLPGTPSSPQDVANRAQTAATDAIAGAKGRANAAYMGALQPGARVPEPMLQAFESRLNDIIASNPNNASAQGLARAVKERLRLPGGPETEPKPLGGGAISSRISVKPAESPPAPWLDDPAQLKGAVDDAIQSFGSNALNTAAPRADLNRYAQEIRNAWKQTVRAGTPGMEDAAGAARQVYESEVNPMRKSITGRVAGVSGANDVREATDKLTSLFGKGTPVKSPTSDILTFEKDIRGQHPGLFADAVATNLADRITRVLPTEGARTDENLANNLRKALADNPDQERGLRDMLAGAARSKGLPEKPVVDGFNQLVELATLAGKRPARVSGLPVPELMEEAGKSKLASAVQLQSYYQAGKRIRMAFSSDAYKTLDRLINDPDGLQLLQSLSKKSIMSPANHAAISAFFGAEGQDSGPK